MRAEDADKLAQVMTECYASTLGCKRLPVRMIVEILTNDPDGADAEFVMMCADHAATYAPRGRVIQDQMLVNDDNLRLIKEIGA